MPNFPIETVEPTIIPVDPEQAVQPGDDCIDMNDEAQIGVGPFSVLNRFVQVQQNNFQHKSLSDWSCNIALGCLHGCRFCYVPETSANKQIDTLKFHGIDNPDEQWGGYTLLRRFDEATFLASLKTAENRKPQSCRKMATAQ